MGWVVGMRAEDRKPSKRVFPLLQNLDLDTVTFAQVQSVGDPISIEDMNEQELQDLVLVNLARLAVSGEWTGLLEAGGGGGTALPGVVGSYHYFNMADAAPYAVGPNTTVTADPTASDDAFGYIFQAFSSGTLDELGLYLNNDGSFIIGIYEMDDDGLPSTLVGKGTVTNASGGASAIYQSTITGSGGGSAGSLTKGTNYWVWFIRATASSNVAVYSIYNLDRGRIFGASAANSTTGGTVKTTTYDSSSGLPDTFTTTAMAPDNGVCPKIVYKVA